MSATKQRNDEVYQRLEPVIKQLHTMEPKWHHTCYQSYTSVTNLKYAQPMLPADNLTVASNSHDVQGSSSGNRLRSSTPVFDWSLCLFCQCKSHKKNKRMYNISTFNASKKILDAANAKEDFDMIARIGDVDLIAMKARYHNSCRAQYTSKTNLMYTAFKEAKGKDVYGDAFAELVIPVVDGIKQGKAYELTSLLTKYKSILREKGVSTADSYTNQRLKLRLKDHFKYRVVFHEQHQQSKSQLMYSSQISFHEVISAACSAKNVDQRSGGRTHITEHDPMQTLYHAAKIIKSEL